AGNATEFLQERVGHQRRPLSSEHELCSCFGLPTEAFERSGIGASNDRRSGVDPQSVLKMPNRLSIIPIERGDLAGDKECRGTRTISGQGVECGALGLFEVFALQLDLREPNERREILG